MIQFENVTLRYKDQAALQDVSFTLEKNVICGLLGRNGAGKTSLMSLLAAYRRPSEGTIRLFGKNPYENPDVVQDISFIYDKNEDTNSFKVREVLEMAASFRPNWDAEYAKTLIRRFEIPMKKSMMSLSHGMRAAVHVIIGLAGRVPITIYDEAYLGMDAAFRKLFIGEILDDYMREPRTILFSTHYIDEMERLFGEVMILDKGRVIIHEDADSLRQRGVMITGNSVAVDQFAAGREILSQRCLGTQKEIVFSGSLTDSERGIALNGGLAVTSPSLQDMFVYLTGKAGDQDDEE